ncbi:hypothetical protein BTVI_38174 [Pitangus sulphuratus]|nr:hypothetical protein BTVI_38174 [Pitangus sulphuratus]
MAAVGERRSLPSPEAMLGQPWSHWVDAAKLHGNDGTALEESFKEYGRNREAMRLCREEGFAQSEAVPACAAVSQDWWCCGSRTDSRGKSDTRGNRRYYGIIFTYVNCELELKAKLTTKFVKHSKLPVASKAIALIALVFTRIQDAG